MSGLAADIPRPGGRPRPDRRRDFFWMWVTVLLVVVAGLAATIYSQYLRSRDPDIAVAVEPQFMDPVTDVPIMTDEPPPPIIEAPELEPTLPRVPLDESDAPLTAWFTDLFGADTVARLLVPENIVRNIVVTIDNLPREELAVQQRPVRPTPGVFVVAGPEDELVIATSNYARYAPFMLLVRNTDALVPVALYERFRPLFQEAYEDLGYPNRSFDARLVEVIDHLLATPEVRDPVRLVQPRVVYEYADPALEARSAGQKWLLRMGPTNAALVKRKLHEVRAALVGP